MGTKTQKLSNIVDQVVEWQSVFTGDGSTGLTAVAGRGYFIDTTSGTVTVTLPASPKIGDVVEISDIASKFATNNVTIDRNGSNINGSASNVILSSTDTQRKFVYSNSTYGWIPVNADNELPAFISATGGTVTTSGDFKIHTFTGDGCFVVSCAGNSSGSNSVDYLVVAGGGSGGMGATAGGAGAGAGGLRISSGTSSGCYTVSPLGACVPAIVVTSTTYPITVGGGGASAPGPGAAGNSGSNSVFSTITSAGGGAGAGHDNPGSSGGSGSGGIGAGTRAPETGYAGNTPPVSPPQGNPGGTGANTSPNFVSGGGGGAGASGGNAPSPSGNGGDGGSGIQTNINGTLYYFAGGGGSEAWTEPGTRAGNGGLGGGGGGHSPISSGSGGGCALNPGSSGGPAPSGLGGAGGANTGGGGGGGTNTGCAASGAGGKGIVILRYKFQ